MEIYTDKDMVGICYKCLYNSVKSCKTIPQLDNSKKMLDNYESNFNKAFKKLTAFKQDELIRYTNIDTKIDMLFGYIKAKRIILNTDKI